MNRIELIDKLEESKILLSFYSVKGIKENALCIIEMGTVFELAYFERGTKTSFGVYAHESQICEAMFNKLNSLE
jgi:hypothetical protein